MRRAAIFATVALVAARAWGQPAGEIVPTANDGGAITDGEARAAYEAAFIGFDGDQDIGLLGARLGEYSHAYLGASKRPLDTPAFLEAVGLHQRAVHFRRAGRARTLFHVATAVFGATGTALDAWLNERVTRPGRPSAAQARGDDALLITVGTAFFLTWASLIIGFEIDREEPTAAEARSLAAAYNRRLRERLGLAP